MANCTVRRMAVAVFLAAALIAAGPAARGADFDLNDDPVHLDELAAYLQQVSNSLCWEMHRYHRHQPEFTPAYRSAKELWSMSGALRDSLRAGPQDVAALTANVAKMNDLFASVQKTAAQWGDGERPPVTTPPAEPRTVVVTPGRGVDIDIPFIGGGVRVGTPRVMVADPAPPVLDRRRFHPNARGSRRALERELAGVRTALDYLLEDTGVASGDSSPPPTPMPPEPGDGPSLSPPVKIGPPAKK